MLDWTKPLKAKEIYNDKGKAIGKMLVCQACGGSLGDNPEVRDFIWYCSKKCADEYHTPPPKEVLCST